MAERRTPRVLTGWGRTAPSVSATVPGVARSLPEVLAGAGERGVIARGLGRSYGDAAQNSGGLVILPVPESIDLDARAGTVRVSAGTGFHTLVRELVPRGFFVPVTPGTRDVTVGGAIACDVHGKNHHRSGSLGDHVLELTLVGADGQSRTVGPDVSPDLFWATVGGMGLTGVITSAVIRLLPVETGWMSVDTDRLDDLDAVMSAMATGDDDYTYSVAWIDTLARGRHLGRSVLSRGEHAGWDQLSGGPARSPHLVPGRPRLAAPPMVPPRLISRPTVRAFNEAWFRKAPRERRGELQSIAGFFYPLDGVAGWNRLYGRRGFVQYQFVVPDAEAEVVRRMLARIAAAGHPSFLAVLKRFGPGNPGLLSFPTSGWTLALDLPVDPALRGLFAELDESVVAAGGRVYLAKDSRLPAHLVQQMYPRLPEFRRIRAAVDPDGLFQSDLARRLGL